MAMIQVPNVPRSVTAAMAETRKAGAVIEKHGEDAFLHLDLDWGDSYVASAGSCGAGFMAAEPAIRLHLKFNDGGPHCSCGNDRRARKLLLFASAFVLDGGDIGALCAGCQARLSHGRVPPTLSRDDALAAFPWLADRTPVPEADKQRSLREIGDLAARLTRSHAKAKAQRAARKATRRHGR
jgi:hypothetical protein